jgi:hypothetical protein
MAHIPRVHVTIGDINMQCHLLGLWPPRMSNISTSESVEGKSCEFTQTVDLRFLQDFS